MIAMSEVYELSIWDIKGSLLPVFFSLGDLATLMSLGNCLSHISTIPIKKRNSYSFSRTKKDSRTMRAISELGKGEVILMIVVITTLYFPPQHNPSKEDCIIIIDGVQKRRRKDYHEFKSDY